MRARVAIAVALSRASRAACGRRRSARAAEVAGAGVGLHVAGRVRPGSDRSRRAVRRRAGRPHPRRPQRRRARHGFPRSVARRSSARRRARPARPGVRAGLRDERPLLRQLHQPTGDTVVARFRRSARSAASPIRRRGSICGGRRGGRRSSRSRSRTTTAATWRSGRTATSTSASATAARGNDPDHRAQNPRELLGKMLRIDVNVPDGDPTGYRVPPDNPFVGGTPVRRARRSGRSACAIRGATASTIRRAAAPARSSSATSARTRGKRSTTSRAARGGRNYGWRNREGAHDNVTSRPPAYPAARRSDLRVRPRASASRSPAASSIAAARCGGVSAAATSSPTSCRAASGRSALTIDARPARRARRTCVEHTAELGGVGALGNISSFGVDADGELYIVELLARPRPEDRRPASRAAGADRPAHHPIDIEAQDVRTLRTVEMLRAPNLER